MHDYVDAESAAADTAAGCATPEAPRPPAAATRGAASPAVEDPLAAGVPVPLAAVVPGAQQLQLAEAAVTQLLLALAPEAPAAMAKAADAVKPLLLQGAPATAAVVTAGLQQLYTAASSGTLAADGIYERVQAGLRQLAAGSTAGVRSAGSATGGGRVATGSSGLAAAGRQPSSRGAKRTSQLDQDDEVDPKKPCLDDKYCSSCGSVEGEQMVCDWCCEATMHPGCAGLPGVPEGAWLCPGCSTEQRLLLVQHCYQLEGSWVRARFGIKWAWGRVEYCSHGELAVQYDDGTLLSPYSTQQLRGAAPLQGHSYFRLVQQADVPAAVVAKFAAEGWLDA